MSATKAALKVEINDYLDVYSEEQLILLRNVIKTFSGSNLNKHSLMELVLSEDQIRKCDTAMPQPYVDSIREILPSLDTWKYCYNYNDKSFGEMYSISDAIVDKLADVLSNDKFEV